MDRVIPVAGIVQGPEEIAAVHRVLEGTWHVSGPECTSLQEELAALVGLPYCTAVNSGSSANLLAIRSLDLSPHSKILTCGGGFPATLNPILHAGHRPVLVDYDLESHNVNIDQLEEAVKADEGIRAIIVAHTLGNPLDVDRLVSVCRSHGVYFIEDCCEALGSTYKSRHVGSYGDACTLSFYSSHQINGLGGGGAVLTCHLDLHERMLSMRDWGKVPRKEGPRSTRLTETVDGIPYDAQYTYKTIGFNSRYPDANCAYAREQLKRLPSFNASRKRNYLRLEERLAGLPLVPMKRLPGAEPAYFAYPLTLHRDYPGNRDQFVEYLESRGVRTRLFFAGNITRHTPYRTWFTHLPVSDYLMRRSLFCGCWHGLTLDDMDCVASVILEYFA